MDEKYLTKIRNQAKWSVFGNLFLKAVTPLSTIILARMITPEEFGIVTIITVVLSIADIFSDAGFSKYLIQKEFSSEKEENNSFNVAFSVSLVLSLTFWFIFSFFSSEIAILLEASGISQELCIAGIQIPLTAISSVLLAHYNKKLNFKDIFKTRIYSSLIYLFVTICLAYLELGYWSLIIGSTIQMFVNVLLLAKNSLWKPKIYFNFETLSNMFTFSSWSLLEAISQWLTVNIDTILISKTLSSRDLGLYKTSTNTVNGYMNLPFQLISPVLFPVLSKIKYDMDVFRKYYYTVQKYTAMIMLPLGVGIFAFKELITYVMLGSNWSEASKIVGIWALISSIVVVFKNFNGVVYLAIGVPKYGFWIQCTNIIVLIPSLIISSKYGFWMLIYIRSLVRLQPLIFDGWFLKKTAQISIIKSLKRIYPVILSTLIMYLTSVLLSQVSITILWQLVSVFICMVVYFISIFFLDKAEVHNILRHSKLLLQKNKLRN